jgi:hypothetical protein
MEVHLSVPPLEVVGIKYPTSTSDLESSQRDEYIAIVSIKSSHTFDEKNGRVVAAKPEYRFTIPIDITVEKPKCGCQNRRKIVPNQNIEPGCWLRYRRAMN